MENTVSRIRARMAIAVVMLLVASALLAAQAKPADASELAEVPASIFLQLSDHIDAPSISGGWFAKYDGVDGEALDENHNKWIEVLAISFGASKPGTGATGSSRRRGAPDVRDFEIVFDYEKASPKLLDGLLRGKVFPSLDIELTVSFGNQRATYLKYEMKNVQVVNYDVHGVADGTRPMVSVSNYFEEIKVTYTEFDDTGSPAGNVEANWKREPVR